MCNKLGLKKRSEIYLYPNEWSDSKSNRRKLINYRKFHRDPMRSKLYTLELNNQYTRHVYNYQVSIEHRINDSNQPRKSFYRKLVTSVMKTWENY